MIELLHKMLYFDRLPPLHMTTATQHQRPSAVQVARCLVGIAYDEQEDLLSKAGDDDYKEEVQPAIDHLKLQKLVYFSQAMRLAAYDEKLFDEEIEAWPLGPVVSSVYHAFKPNADRNITKEQGSFEGIDEETREYLRQVWLEFGKYSSIQLVNITHKHQPWKEARERNQKVISEDTMKTFYKSMLASSNAQTSRSQ
jgi:uncharacterized phage-associated protein